MIESVLSVSPKMVLFSGLGLLVLWLYSSWAKHCHIPGPTIASISNIPRLVWSWSGKPHEMQIRLHKKYGKIVRLGPNCISVGDPQEISKVYGTAANMPKSDFYRVFQPMVRGHLIQGIFNTQDDALHRALRRPIAGMYSMTNLVEFEPYVDTTISFFLDQLEKLQVGKVCDIGQWLQYFAFDVMGEITFSKRLGFLDEARDIEGIIANTAKVSRYGALVGQVPWIDQLWAKNPLVRLLTPEKSSAVVEFALARARERKAAQESEKVGMEYNSRDFMSRFFDVKAKGDNIPDHYVTAWATSNVQAGSDTTAILLRGILYFLLKHPASLSKLMAELAQARVNGRLSDVVTWKESRELPYLDACIKEAGRLHPAVGLALERVVPKGGAVLCGKTIAAGTVVGINAWVAHRDEEVFGADAHEWNPDRWLEDKDRRVAMERCLLTFGSGHRTCLGKNISYLEIYKLIPTLLTQYEISLVKDWTVTNHWLAFQTDFQVRLRKRESDWATTDAAHGDVKV
ncbi:putative cytochrome P450 pisatin demethylase-like protein [Podospora conica]|nr:putative cytochrome P450 pisatin demethylase-like protein [Schizothecium conicum]